MIARRETQLRAANAKANATAAPDLADYLASKAAVG
jgi:hypothetical protein